MNFKKYFMTQLGVWMPTIPRVAPPDDFCGGAGVAAAGQRVQPAWERRRGGAPPEWQRSHVGAPKEPRLPGPAAEEAVAPQRPLTRRCPRGVAPARPRGAVETRPLMVAVVLQEGRRLDRGVQ